jgi:hypothetical protein
MHPLFLDYTIEHNKKSSFGLGRRTSPTGRRDFPTCPITTKFALQTHRNFGSLALWQNRWLSLYRS